MNALLDEAPAAAPRLPRVSVVVPTCGRPPLLLRCLQALAGQSLAHEDYEILVVDDERSEVTHAAVEAFAAGWPPGLVRYLRAEHGRGPAAARNAGWRAARAEVVAFTDDDTVPDAGWLAYGLGAMDAVNWAAVAGRVVVPRPEGADERPTDHELMTRGLESAEFVTANAFVRRDALERVGGFDERFRRAWREDSDLQFRLESEAGEVGRCDAAVVRHPVRPERWGVSLRQQKNVFYDALLYAKHPRRYRERVRAVPPWDYLAIVALVLAAPLLALGGASGSAVLALLVALGLVAAFAGRRLRATSRRPAHVAEMLLTSLLIPFLAVWWRLRGAWHFRVWFL
ncbi:glycosyltransferase family 2 protein [Rubrivivax gelatinosus]|uniref:Cellulose synthase/poly-beta-1,6-N-acetylglucosamine synthase-like glycosyltransferase n=1 Tax=Rubrivivax gelatinosus TaxID=28068 RepID=A0A4R2MI65_RUBGE|nr:glycosyltransferase [Rubrivivax gelatinosus]MBK1686420.1 glycosyl transferase family 2 [Rubrivivax gelatinosus]TCP04354.1 cellulose synthase/poly-beta-1,6-N-acetylglucosamine synthase-like glycosyltransferase [Rubrivivax gelatinosus]